jgi:hypothetical protein
MRNERKEIIVVAARYYRAHVFLYNPKRKADEEKNVMKLVN